jgi:hypothetical protein
VKNLVDYGIIGLLLALSLWALAVGVERWLYYRRVAMNQFDNIQLMEMALTKRLGDWNGSRECTLHRAVGHCVGDHADVPYNGYVGNDGRRRNHGRLKDGLGGD